jgi:hypothetical protein
MATAFHPQSEQEEPTSYSYCNVGATATDYFGGFAGKFGILNNDIVLSSCLSLTSVYFPRRVSLCSVPNDSAIYRG